MIRDFSEWDKINEVEELTEKQPVKKFLDQVIKTYAKYPKLPPSRDIVDYANAAAIQGTLEQQEFIKDNRTKQGILGASAQSSSTEAAKRMWVSWKPMSQDKTILGKAFQSNIKGTLKLDEFIKERSGDTFAQLLTSIINDWYYWPEESKARKVLLSYINNDDDLDNVTIGKIFSSDMTLLLPIGLAGTAFAAACPPAAFVYEFAIQSSASAIFSYVAYGNVEAIKDDPLLQYIAPIVPEFKGIFGEDPFAKDYQSVFNTMMLLIYDTWNLCMGQESNMDWKRPVWSEEQSTNTNPIRNFNTGKSNYLDVYMETFCKSTGGQFSSNIKGSFMNFMKELNSACTEDQNNSEIFFNCPFFYTGGKILLIDKDDKDKTSRLTPNEFKDWVKKNYVNNEIQPTVIPLAFFTETRKSRLFASAFKRKDAFFSNVSQKLNTRIKMYGSSGVTIEKISTKKGQLLTLPDLENEIIIKMYDNPDYKFRIQYENISSGGNKIVFEMVKKKTKSKKSTVSLDSIKEDIITSSPSEFSGMRDI